MYNIVDDFPINTTEFSEPILTALGYEYKPIIAVPGAVITTVAAVEETVGYYLRKVGERLCGFVCVCGCVT